MTKIALITDTHFGIRNDSPHFHDYFIECFNWFFREIDNEEIKDIIHLGDLFDRRKYVNFLTAKNCRENFLEQIDKRNVNTKIIIGNHDQYYKDSHKVNSLEELVSSNRYKTIEVLSTPKEFDYEGKKILLVPWISSSNKEEVDKALKKSSADIVAGHFEFIGFEMYRGSIVSHGDTTERFRKFSQVWSGHYHHKSSVGNVHYLGAFAEYIWSDYADDRGYHIFDTSTGKLEFRQNPNRMFHSYVYDGGNFSYDKSTLTCLKGKYVRIVVRNRINPGLLDDFISDIYDSGCANLVLVESEIDNKEISESIESTADLTIGTDEMISKYIQELQLDEHMSKNKMIDFMRGVYKEAISNSYVG